MDHAPAVASPPSRSHSEQGGDEGHSIPRKPKPASATTDVPNSRSSSDKENANVPTSTPRQRRPKVRFTDMEPEPTPLLFNARDSMYMRAELQRELDFGIPAQEEAHRYARWCAEEARREAAEASESSDAAGSNYAKADTVVHPKRISTDLGAMDIDLANLGEDVSGLDVFSRVEAALGKKQEEKRKQKAQKEKDKKDKKDSTREKLKASLMASPKRENSYSSLDEPVAGPTDSVKEKKGSRFLRKVISDRVIKPKDGSAAVNSNHATGADDARTKEIADFFGKMSTQSAPGQPIGAPLPQNTPPGKSPSMERSISDIPTTTTRKEAPFNTISEGRRPSHPEIRPPPPPATHANGRPPSKSEPPPPPQPRQIPPSQFTGKAPPLSNEKSSAQTPTIRAVPGVKSPGVTVKATPRPSTQPREDTQSNDSTLKNIKPNSTASTSEEGDKHRPSFPTHRPSHSYSQSLHHAPPTPPAQNGSTSTLQPQDSSRDRNPSPSRSKSLRAPPPPPYMQSAAPASAPSQPPKQVVAADDLFSRIEQDIARNHPPVTVKEKGGDERTRDKGRKLFGKALEHIKHGGEKMKEKIDKEKMKEKVDKERTK